MSVPSAMQTIDAEIVAPRVTRPTAVWRWGLSFMKVCVWLVIATAAAHTYAGCGYEAHGLQSMPTMSHENGTAHSFLDGQWVYEGGLTKFVPRERSIPCHGPLCRAGKDVSSDSMSTSPAGGHHRLPVMHAALFIDAQQDRCEEVHFFEAVELSGYPSIPEHPPRF
ncbi:MAG: hypothetical protein U0892_06960 [Pirellulales bacterium]